MRCGYDPGRRKIQGECMASREELFRRQRERANVEARIGQAIQSGDARVFPTDRFGAPVTPGSKVLFRPSYDFVYSVVDVKPVLDPAAPPGLITVTLATETTLTLPTGTPLMNMVRVAFGAEEQPKSDKEQESAAPSAQGDGDPGQPEESTGPRLVLTDSH